MKEISICLLRRTLFLLFFFSPIALLAQTSVSGVVTANGEPVSGASVSQEGQSSGTTTDEAGKFQLTVKGANPKLLISHVGYQIQTINVDGRTDLQIVLESADNPLDEVVVIGYGTVRKGDLTGAVTSVKSEDLNKGVVASVDQAMKGRIAGVQVSQTSAEPGGGISVRIRGANSITSGNEPLYVVDGLPINNAAMLQSGGAGYVSGNPNTKNPLNSLNPSDIESIEILKDASATAIYGSRGANGVVIITTKSGKNGKMSVGLDNYMGVQSVYKRLDVLSTAEYINAVNELSIAGGGAEVFTPADISSIGAGTDWQSEIFRRALVQSNNLSFSGGNQKSKYFASFNYFNQQGIVKSSGMRRYTLRLNLEHQLSDKFKLGVNLNNSFINDDNNVDGTGINETAGPLNSAFQYDPTEPVYAPDGKFSVSSNLTLNNPVAIINAVQSNTQTNRVFGSAYLRYNLLKDLFAQFRLGADRQSARRDIYNARSTFWGGAGAGQANIAMLERNSELLEYTMQYNKSMEHVDLNAVAGATYERFESRSFSAAVNGFPTDVLGTNNLGLGNTENASVGSNKSENSIVSFLGRVNATLYDKFLLTASLRRDGSSKFGANTKWANFPSFAAAWRLSEEDFVPGIFDDLKLRVSWGKTGNQSIANYASLTTFALGDLALLGNSAVVGTVPSRIPNADLKWETTNQFNAGIDFAFFNNRLRGSLDYFMKNTHDMLLYFPLPRSTGYDNILSNIGSMRNTGIDVMLSSDNVDKQNFKWTTTAVFSFLKNEVTDIGSLTQINTGNIFTSNIGIIKPGLPLNAYYTYKVIGIFQTAEEVAKSAQPSSKPGNPIYLDANGDGSITADDRVVVGSPWPDYTFGLRNNFQLLKGLEIDIFIDGQLGAQLLNGNAVESLYPVNPRRNRIREQIVDRWTPDNPGAKWPSALNPATYGADKVSSLVVEDADFVRLQTVQLGYNFPLEASKFIRNIKLYATAQNLVMLTNYSGVNPEANAYGNSNIRADYSSYPLSRTYIIGLNLSF